MLHHLARSLPTGLCIVLLCFASLSAAKECVIPWSLHVKRANGTVDLVLNVPPGYLVPIVNIDLSPGDSLLVDMDPNGYCGPNDAVMTVRAGWSDEDGVVLEELQGAPLNCTFRRFGDMFLDIEAFATINGTAVIRVFEVEAPAVETIVHEVPRVQSPAFNPTVQDGLLLLGGNPAGTLTVADAAGRTVHHASVPSNAQGLPMTGSGAGAYTVVLRYNGECLYRKVVVVQ